MEIRGRRPRVFGIEPSPSIDQDSFNQPSAASAAGSASAATRKMAAAGDSRTNFDVMFIAAVAASSSNASGGGGGDGSGGQEERGADIGALMRIMEEGVSGPGGVGALEWSWLSHQEAGDKARKLYRKAAHAQVGGGAVGRTCVGQGACVMAVWRGVVRFMKSAV